MEKIITSAAGGATTAVLAWIARYHDPLYSDGWLLNNPQLLYIPVIVVVAAIIMSLWTSGLVTLFLLTLVAASIFAWLYGRSDQSEPWPVITWILHLVIFAMIVGIVAGLARNLFTEYLDLSIYMWLRMILFVVVLTLLWALPTHYAARMLVNSDPRAPANGGPCFNWASIWLPRLLGFLTFLAVEVAIWRSYKNIPTLDEQDVVRRVEHALIAMAVLVAVSAAAYLVWIFNRPRDFRPTGLLGRLNTKLGTFWQAVSPGRVQGSADEESRDFGRLILAAVFLVFAVIFLAGADRIAHWFPRSMAIPFILGGWLPFLTYLSGVGRQLDR